MKNTKNIGPLSWINKVIGKKKIYIIILLIIQIFLGVSSVFYAVILRNVIDEAVNHNTNGFIIWVIIFALLVIIQILLKALSRFLEEHSRALMENILKGRFLSYIMKSDYGKVSRIHSGEWMNRLTSDTVVVADGLTQIVPGVFGMIVRIIGTIIMIVFLIPSFLYILIPCGIALIWLSYAFRSELKRLHKRVQESDGKLREYLQESIYSLLVIQAFGKENQTMENADIKMDIHKKARMKRTHFSNICNIGFGGVMQGAYVLGVLICGYGLLLGTMSYGTLMAILQLINQVQSPFANITGYLPKYYAMLASCERLIEIEYYGYNKELLPFEQIKSFYEKDFKCITFEDVRFTYKAPIKDINNAMPVVLDNVNLSIKKGDYVAFTGPSGCGKSTILKLMMCIYPLDFGEIFFNETNSIVLNAKYRQLFAYVPQGNHLMSGSIREIIAFSDKKAMEDEERIKRALYISCGIDFVNEFDLGIDTVLGERGLGLSEGQMQRIAIARAIFSEHPILILDESTSALDEETEERLLINLRKMTDKTVLIVTHRKAVLSICDKEIRLSEKSIEINDLKKEAEVDFNDKI